MAGGHLSRGQRSASRLVPELAARRPGHARPPAVPRRSLTHGFLIDVDGRKMSKSLGNTDPAAGSDQGERRGDPAPVGRDERLPRGAARRQADPRARRRGVPQDPQHAAVSCVSNLYDFDPAADACRSTQLHEVDRFALARYGDDGQRRCSRAYERYDYPAIFQTRQPVRDGRPERVLRRRVEGSAVHVCRRVARAPVGADRDVHHGRRPGAAARADPAGHGRRAVAAPARDRATPPCTWQAFPTKRSTRSIDEPLAGGGSG